MSRSGIGTTDCRLPARTNQAYTRVNAVTYSGSQLVDIWKPNATNRPALILLHGGAWTSQARDSYPYYPTLATRFAERGFAVFDGDYRYAPPGSAQDPIDDTLALVQWVRTNAATYNADATRVACLGISAGAHLSLMAGITGVVGTTRPDAVVSWSAAIDFFNSDPLANATILAYTGAADFNDVTTISRYSPLQRLQAVGRSCPMRIVGSSNEDLIGWVKQANADDLYAAAIALGIPATKRIFTGNRHAFFDGQDGPFYNAGVGTSRENGLAANDIPGTCLWLRNLLGEPAVTPSRTAATRTAASNRAAPA